MRLKIWLSLTLVVLLLHLALLQALPLDRPVTSTPGKPTFATGTVMLTRTPTPDAAQPTSPRPSPTREPTSRPPARRVPAQAESAPGVTALPEHAQPMAESPTGAASAPATAATPPASAPDGAAEPTASALASPATELPPPLPATEIAFSAERLPPSVKLSYQVEANKFPYTLSGEFLWQRRGQTYHAQLSISTFGQTRVQTSRGQIAESGLAPERFSDKYRSEVAAHFNRAQGLVSFSANTPNLALQPGAQDRLSVLVQLAALVASAPQHFGPGTTLQVQTIGPRDGDLWLFTFGELENLELPGGPQQGLKLVRQPRQPYDQKLEVWLAPDLAYLPARIRITEANGNYVDQKWVASQPVNSP